MRFYKVVYCVDTQTLLGGLALYISLITDIHCRPMCIAIPCTCQRAPSNPNCLLFWSLQSCTNSDVRLHVVAYTEKNIQAYSFVAVYCMNFIFVIFLCATLKLFSLSFVSLLAPNPGDTIAPNTVSLHISYSVVLVMQRFGVGLMIERSLVRLQAGALSSQLGQLSLPSLRGR